jgi:allantoicase
MNRKRSDLSANASASGRKFEKIPPFRETRQRKGGETRRVIKIEISFGCRTSPIDREAIRSRFAPRKSIESPFHPTRVRRKSVAREGSRWLQVVTGDNRAESSRRSFGRFLKALSLSLSLFFSRGVAPLRLAPADSCGSRLPISPRPGVRFRECN